MFRVYCRVLQTQHPPSPPIRCAVFPLLCTVHQAPLIGSKNRLGDLWRVIIVRYRRLVQCCTTCYKHMWAFMMSHNKTSNMLCLFNVCRAIQEEKALQERRGSMWVTVQPVRPAWLIIPLCCHINGHIIQSRSLITILTSRPLNALPSDTPFHSNHVCPR